MHTPDLMLSNLTEVDVKSAGENDTSCPAPLGYSTMQAVLRLSGNVPLIAIGVLFNGFEIIVFSRPRMRQSFINWFLLAMAASDLLLLLCMWFMIPLPVLVENWPPSPVATGHHRAATLRMANVATRWALPIGNLAHTSVVSLTVAVNFYRYMGLCHPFQTMSLVTGHRALGGIISCLLFSAVFTLPRWFEVDTSACWVYDHLGQLLSILILVRSDVGSHRYYVLIYKVIACNIVMFVIPFVLIVWLNTRIFLTLRWALPVSRHHPRPSVATTTNCHQSQSAMHHDRLVRPRSTTVGVLDERRTSTNDRRTSTDDGRTTVADERKISFAVDQHVHRKLAVVGLFHHLTLSPAAAGQRPSSSTAGTLIRNELNDRRPPVRGSATSSHVSAGSGGRERESSVSRMLAAVAALFLACNTLPFVNNCLDIVITIWPSLAVGTSAKVFTVLVELGNVLITLNSAASLPIYWVFSSRFRSESKALLFQRPTCASCCVAKRRDCAASNLSRAAAQLPTTRCRNSAMPAVRCTGTAVSLRQIQTATEL